jgi:malonyl-CoA O-methyltransferase
MARADAAPWLHDEVARRMAERVSLIRQAPSAVLDWSQDAGKSLGPLREVCPKAELSLVAEAAPDAQAGAGWRAGLRRLIHREPVRVTTLAVPPKSSSLVWSNMALHFDDHPPERMQSWHQALRVDGFVMFSTLGPGSLAQLRAVYQQLGWPKPHAPFVDMHDLGDMLVAAGFADPVMDQELLTLTYADPESLLTELRQLGGNLAPDRFAGCRTPAWRQQLLQALRASAGADSRIRLDFEVVYGHAFRAPDRGPAVAERTTVDLDQMKSMLRDPSRRPSR